jgi:drug/metabolite transporter (DMT)-like permease
LKEIKKADIQRERIMKPVILAVSALILYSIQNVILEQKLAKYDAFGLLMYFYFAMLPLAIIGLGYKKIMNQPAPLPEGSMIIFVLILGVVYFMADSCMVLAYTSGGSLITVATIIAMFPVVASAVKFAWTGNLPNIYQAIGYVLAFLAVIFVAKGSAS